MSKRDERSAVIREAARQLFVERTIEGTTFSEIAARAGVGEATVYRHYSSKGDLAMAIAMTYAEAYHEAIEARLKACQGSHIDKFTQVVDHFIRLFEDKPDFYIYLEHFDNFLVHSSDDLEGLEAYEALFVGIGSLVCDLERGEVPDTSVRHDINLALATHTYAVTLISLCQKLLLRGGIFREDLRYSDREALRMMRNMMIDSLAAGDLK